MKLLLIRQVWKHHTSKSGYDRVFQTFEGSNVKNIIFRQHLKGYGLITKILQLIFPSRKKYISANILILEVKILLKSIFFKPDIIHFTYLQKDFILFRFKFFRPNAKLIATMHLPPSFRKEGEQSKCNFEYLDGIIVLDKVSYDFFNQMKEVKGEVCLIPHPVDTEYFIPNNSLKVDDGKIHCLHVGRFLRNIDLLFDLFEYCSHHNPSLIFHFVYPLDLSNSSFSKKWNIIKDLPNVHHYEEISDGELLKMYQSSDVLIQVLKDSTANNVILEAMACQLPVVVNYLPQLETYIKNNSFIFDPENPILFVDEILSINKNSLIKDQYSYLNEFSLEKNKAELNRFYESFFN